MVDVLLSEESIDVIGGAPRVNVDINFGASGDRGSNIFVGAGNPNLPTALIPRTPQNYDMYINLAPNDSEYLFLYQYLNFGGTLSWVRLLRLVPNTFLENKLLNFVDGKAVYNVPVATVIPLASVGIYQPSNFNIQHRVTDSVPLATSTSVSSQFQLTEDGELVLPVTISAVGINPETGEWSNLSGPKVVNLLMTVI
jgi:hypothetical protein